MKKDCSNCDHLGRDCPKKLMLLELDELIDWCHYVMTKHKITHDFLARLANIPKGTVDRVMAKQSADCRYSTIHAIVCALFEFLGISAACLDDVAIEAAAHTDELKAQNVELQHALADAEKDVQTLRTRVEDITESRALLKDTIRGQRWAIRALAALLSVAVLVIIAALVADKLNPALGFIWR